MAIEKPLYNLSVAGMRLKVRSSHDEDKVNALVDLVNQKVNLALKRSKNKSLQKAIILAALNLAEELVNLKGQARQELDRIEDLAFEVVSDLESARIDKIGIS